jgi:hypothetical protein
MSYGLQYLLVSRSLCTHALSRGCYTLNTRNNCKHWDCINDWVGNIKILNSIEHFLLCRCIPLPPVSITSANGLGRVRVSLVFLSSCNWGTLNTVLQICLLFRNRYLVGSSWFEYLVVWVPRGRYFRISVVILESHLMFTNFARCFVFLLGVKPFCLLFCRSLGVFHFAWSF